MARAFAESVLLPPINVDARRLVRSLLSLDIKASLPPLKEVS